MAKILERRGPDKTELAIRQSVESVAGRRFKCRCGCRWEVETGDSAGVDGQRRLILFCPECKEPYTLGGVFVPVYW